DVAGLPEALRFRQELRGVAARRLVRASLELGEVGDEQRVHSIDAEKSEEPVHTRVQGPALDARQGGDRDRLFELGRAPRNLLEGDSKSLATPPKIFSQKLGRSHAGGAPQ